MHNLQKDLLRIQKLEEDAKATSVENDVWFVDNKTHTETLTIAKEAIQCALKAEERVKKLEAVAEASIQLCAFTYDAYILVSLPKGRSESKRVPAVQPDLLERLRETLRALNSE